MGKTWFTFQDQLSMTIDCLVLYKKSNEKLITKKLKLLDFTQQSKPPNIRSPYFAVIDVWELKTIIYLFGLNLIIFFIKETDIIINQMKQSKKVVPHFKWIFFLIFSYQTFEKE